MSYNVIVRPIALDELNTYRRWYFRRSPDAATNLIDAFDALVHDLAAWPTAPPLYHGRYRRGRLEPFSIGVFYYIDDRRVTIIAVIDLRRSPARIRRILRGRD